MTSQQYQLNLTTYSGTQTQTKFGIYNSIKP